ncbi:MAG: hypothetical protein CSA65_00555 [Proteobacteria bacterium]|nr:MAG: hypothetical protein CSB49_00115 [Pseudomonadota bacterium]PIE19966.1 MAG: hypothetical protein CSA65_00555 [Pseudomonadota bacterium]
MLLSRCEVFVEEPAERGADAEGTHAHSRFYCAAEAMRAARLDQRVGDRRAWQPVDLALLS